MCANLHKKKQDDPPLRGSWKLNDPPLTKGSKTDDPPPLCSGPLPPILFDQSLKRKKIGQSVNLYDFIINQDVYELEL